jgi:hypothetical protein
MLRVKVNKQLNRLLLVYKGGKYKNIIVPKL